MRRQRLVQVEEDVDGILVRVSPKDGAVQRIVPEGLQERVLTLAHYPKCAGHPGRDKLFRTLRREYFWQGVSTRCADFVASCASCARKRLMSQKRVSRMTLFPPSQPLEFVAIDILGPLPETKNGNRFLLVIADRYSKGAQTVPLAKITATDIAHAFFARWISKYGIP